MLTNILILLLIQNFKYVYSNHKVVATIDHDRNCFTQGLVLHDDNLYESCGLYGQSSIREIDSVTFKIKRELKLKDDIFAEGIVVIEDHIYLLTWTNKFMIIIDRKSFQIVGKYLYTTYTGEGWGLTYDGEQFIISDGSSRIQFFKVPDIKNLGNMRLTTERLVKSREIIVKNSDGKETKLLNELQYVKNNGFIYSNVWYTNNILKIDIFSGIIKELIDLQSLYPPRTRSKTADCLNGIAYNQTDDTFLLTGKLWPKYYKVNFSPLQDTEHSDLVSHRTRKEKRKEKKINEFL